MREGENIWADIRELASPPCLYVGQGYVQLRPKGSLLRSQHERTFMVVVRRLRPLTGTRAPSRSCDSRGVMRHALTVEKAVIVTLSATSARARRVTRLLAVPPTCGREASGGDRPDKAHPTLIKYVVDMSFMTRPYHQLLKVLLSGFEVRL